jgi:predicted proteasome-type protease
MEETPEQAVNRVIDRLKDILKKGTEAEKNELSELLEADSIYGALSLVEDQMQERFDQEWEEAEKDDDAADLPLPILKFPQITGKKKRAAKS